MRFAANASDSAGAARANGHTHKRNIALGIFESICTARNTDKWTKWTLYKRKTENMGFACAKIECERCRVGLHENWGKCMINMPSQLTGYFLHCKNASQNLGKAFKRAHEPTIKAEGLISKYHCNNDIMPQCHKAFFQLCLTKLVKLSARQLR